MSRERNSNREHERRRDRLVETGPTPVERATYSTPIALESIVVRYEDRPDRCAITPRKCAESERLTTRLSADRTAFVDLGASR